MSKRSEKFSSISSKIKFVSGIISWVVLVILVIIALLLLYYFVSAKIYAQKGEEYKPAFALYTILSPSMVPNIKVYDVIVDVNVKSPQDIKEGDVITFISTSSMTKGMTITHRVVQVKEENGKYAYVTKGDANLSPDASPAPFESVQGKVLFHIPQLGRVQEFLGTKGGWLLVVVLPALYVIISDIFKLFRFKNVKNEVDNYEEKVLLEDEKEMQKREETRKRLMERYQVQEEEKQEVPDDIKIDEVREEIAKLDEEVKLDIPQEETNKSNKVILDDLPELKEEFNDDTIYDNIEEEVEEVPEVVFVRGQELVKPKRKRKRKRKRKHSSNPQEKV